ncbi:hypothetical protein ACFCV3_39605 [Kribbella sp. NPDC056345]|uniref:hypothetical protein n=1 Tax=Kribbella sp. NPDC056345 TaxID=3345789 RepID=UPI0035DFA8C5
MHRKQTHLVHQKTNEDLQQEARILVATKPDLQECVRDLADLYKTEARRKDKVVSYEVLLDTRGAA